MGPSKPKIPVLTIVFILGSSKIQSRPHLNKKSAQVSKKTRGHSNVSPEFSLYILEGEDADTKLDPVRRQSATRLRRRIEGVGVKQDTIINGDKDRTI